jgi:uncharacterized Tic20 family protein
MTEPTSPSWDPSAAGGGPGPGPHDTPPPAPPGYTQPPPGNYPPAGGAYQPGYPAGPAPVPPGYASSDDKTWALVAHFGGAAGMFLLGGVGGWIAPLIAMVAKGNQSPTVRAHAVDALNFQLIWSIVGVIGYITLCVVVGFIIIPAAAIIGIVFGIIGGLRANEGQLYKYPMSYPFIK